jgi:DNA polymerase-3 subunit epsilon
MREVVFDTETTGLSASNGDRLVEIGCLELFDRCETGEVFHAYVNPERIMPSEAEAVHGLSDKFLADKPLFADIADDLMGFLGQDTPLIAHNASFDFGFVNAELLRIGRIALAPARMIDTVAMARRLHPGAKHSLDALCARYGIDRSHRVKHGALLDAELLAQLYIELTGGRQIGLGLVDDGSAVRYSPGGGTRDLVRTRLYREPRPHSASPEELVRHSEFIAKIKDALWLESESAL